MENCKFTTSWIHNVFLLSCCLIYIRCNLHFVRLQGEADSGENDVFTKAAYECELNGLISTYRRDFGQPTLPIVIVQLPGNGGTVGFQHDNDTHLAGPDATGWQAIQLAQQNVAWNSSVQGVALVSLPDLGCCGLHYPHKWPVAERAFNMTLQVTLWLVY